MNENHQTLVEHLEVASDLWTRTKGLLGRRDLAEDSGLWILSCNSVHTFFMSFALDLIFLNEDMVVVEKLENVKPGRLVWPVWKAKSVIEVKTGFLKRQPLGCGDRLHVDPTLS